MPDLRGNGVGMLQGIQRRGGFDVLGLYGVKGGSSFLIRFDSGILSLRIDVKGSKKGTKGLEKSKKASNDPKSAIEMTVKKC